MEILASDEAVIPVVLDLQDDNIVEPMDLYQLMIVNISDSNVVVGKRNNLFIVIYDDDVEGKDANMCTYYQHFIINNAIEMVCRPYY